MGVGPERGAGFGISRTKRIGGGVIRGNGGYFVYINENGGFVLGRLLSASPATVKDHYQRILWILTITGLNDLFVSILSERLEGNRRLKKESYILPLIGIDGEKHTFTYVGDHENRFYSLDYVSLGKVE